MALLLEHYSNHRWLVALAVAAAIAVLIYELRQRKVNQAAISPQEAVRLMNQGAPVLDVRSSEEFAAGHVANARHAPLEKLAELAESLKRFKDRPVVVYCERGGRASTAIAQLNALGFKQAFTVRGGVAAWRAEQLPLARS
jgi:rhodanese-related sulfurtransferase